MEYRIKQLEWEEAYSLITNYEYALVYMMSNVYLCKTQDLPTIDWEECLEARFFSEEGELHIYGEDGVLRAVKVMEDEETEKNSIIKKYWINQGRFKGVGKYLIVQEYLDYDEDGQAVITLTRLRGIE